MSSVSLRSTRSSRGRSAGARLETPMPALPEELRKSPRPQSRRVKSARETRREQEFSGEVFPEPEKDPEWGTSSYSLDYGPKRPETPVPMRPISSTRRNNPHPDQSFLVWQYPVRIHEHKRAVPPDPNTWRFIQEGFYDDYQDDYNTGDAKNEVPITNVAKIEFPGKRKKNGYTSTPHLPGISGTKAQLNPRQKPSGNQGVQNGIRAPSPQSRIAHNTLKGNTLPVFKDWLKTASSKERDVVLQMLKAAHDDSEETRLQKVVNDVLQPDSAERVQHWLKSANGSEKQIVLHVLETLAIAADDSDTVTQPDDAHYMHQHQRLSRHHRSQSYPITLRRRSSHHSHSHTHHLAGEYLQYSRHLPRPPSRQASVRSKPLHFGSSGAGGKPSGLEMGLVVKKMSTKERKPTPWAEKRTEKTPEIWHHRIKKKTTGTSNVYPGSVWFDPHKDRGQHFDINPEFPIA